MIRQASTAALFVFSAFLLSSCSGVSGGSCTANCGNGSATISLVLTATPPPPSSQLSIQAFTTTITGITLTPVTGSAVNVPLNSATYVAEFNRVTSDSTLLANAIHVPAANYTQMTVTFSAPRVTFCTQPNPGVPGCSNNSLTSISGTAGSAIVSTNISLTANQQTGFAVNADLGSALTASGQSITAVNLNAANVFSLHALPPPSAQTDLSAGQLAHVDDVMGLVTAVTGFTVTIQTTTRGSISATANSATQFGCAVQSFNGCVQLNTVAVANTVLNADGTLSLTFFQPLNFTNFDIVEGVVTGVPNSVTNQFPLVVTDAVYASTASLLNGQVHLGDQLLVTLTSPQPFVVFSKGLQFPAGSNFENSTSITAIQPGMTLAFPVTAFTAQTSNAFGSAVTQQVDLRFTRITVTTGAQTSPTFTAINLPPFFGLATSTLFQTTPGRLSLDGVSDLTSVTAGTTVSTTALYLGPPASPAFSAESVRTH
jgi:hypothetical protein